MAVDIIQTILLAFVEHTFALVTFALIIIVAFLWRFHFCFNQSRRRLSPSFSDHIAHPPSPAHGTPLDPSLLKHLSSFTYSSTAETEGQCQSPPACVICLIEFKEGDMVSVLPNCDHLFHLDCIDKWLRRNKTCPLCRKVINPPPSVNLPPPIRCPLGVVIEIPEEDHRRRQMETPSGS